MIFKIFALLLIGFLIYIVFFKKNRENLMDKKDDKNEEVDTMIECASCQTYISKQDAILGSGKYFCSKECLN